MSRDKALWFRGICLRNGLRVDDEQILQIERYVELLLQWNRRVNLVSRKDEESIWETHVLHSASVLFKLAFTRAPKILDLGTGGGLPGIPLKILVPDLSIVLLDATAKKVNAVADILNKLSLKDIEPVWGRAEELGSQQKYCESFDIVVARGVAPLNALIKLSVPFLRKSMSGLAETESNARSILAGKIRLIPPLLIALKGGDLSREIRMSENIQRVKSIDEINLVFHGSAEAMFMDKKLILVNVG